MSTIGPSSSLSCMLFAHRTSHHVTTGATPFELMLGRDARLPEDVTCSPFQPQLRTPFGMLMSLRIDCSSVAYERVCQHMVVVQQGCLKESYDTDINAEPYCINDLVFLHNPAVHRPWQGEPFKVRGKNACAPLHCCD